MSVKLKIPSLFLILSLILILGFASGLKAEKKFRFGTWTYGGGGDPTHYYPTPQSLMEVLAKSLKFTYLEDTSKDTVRFNAIQKYDLKIASQIYDSTLTHNGPYYYSYTHHKVWEAEGNEGHPAYFNLVHPDSDTTVDGDTVAYMVLAGVDDAGLIQWGPAPAPYWYTQDTLFRGSPAKVYIPYTAAYRVKAGADPDVEFNDTVAVLYVTWGEDTLAIDTLWDNDFPTHTMTYYLEDRLSWSSQSCGGKSRRVAYNVYWFGRRDFYIDNVTLYDVLGKNLIDGLADVEIYNHIREFFKDSSSLDAWYMREELHGLGDDADHIEPWAYIEKLLADSSEMGVGSMHDTGGHTRYFLDQVNPQVLFIHAYSLEGRHPHRGVCRTPHSYRSDYQGEDSLSLQVAWDTLTYILDLYKDMCEQKGIDYIATLQGHSWKCAPPKKDDPCPGGAESYYHLRPLTGYELECQANLAVAHGAKGVLYWKYWTGWSRGCWGCGLWYQHPDPDSSRYNADSCQYNDTTKWCWIKNKIGPYFDSLGETYYNLTWLGAGSSDNVDSIDGSFITSMESYEFPESPYIEVAFFDSGNTDYFMLVNRRCLTDEEQNVTCKINKGGTYLIVDLCESVIESCCRPDTTLAGKLDSIGAIPFTTHLDPGEGKLFKIVPE